MICSRLSLARNSLSVSSNLSWPSSMQSPRFIVFAHIRPSPSIVSSSIVLLFFCFLPEPLACLREPEQNISFLLVTRPPEKTERIRVPVHFVLPAWVSQKAWCR